MILPGACPATTERVRTGNEADPLSAGRVGTRWSGPDIDRDARAERRTLRSQEPRFRLRCSAARRVARTMCSR